MFCLLKHSSVIANFLATRWLLLVPPQVYLWHLSLMSWNLSGIVCVISNQNYHHISSFKSIWHSKESMLTQRLFSLNVLTWKVSASEGLMAFFSINTKMIPWPYICSSCLLKCTTLGDEKTGLDNKTIWLVRWLSS